MVKHVLAAGLCVLLAGPWARANHGCSTCAHAPKVSCPPPHCHYAEGPPNLKFKKACPRPVCDPCKLEHFGYYQTCWAPWPFPANHAHCPVPHAGAVLPPPAVHPYAPRGTYSAPGMPEYRELPGRRPDAPDFDTPPRRPSDTLPPPRKFDDKPTGVRLVPSR